MNRNLFLATTLMLVSLAVMGIISYRLYTQNKVAIEPPSKSLSQQNFISQMGNATYDIDGEAVLLRKGRNADDTLLLNTDLLTLGNLTKDNSAMAAVTIINDTTSGTSYLVSMVQQGQNSKAYRILPSIPMGESDITAISIAAPTVTVKTKDGTKMFTYTGSKLQEKK